MAKIERKKMQALIEVFDDKHKATLSNHQLEMFKLKKPVINTEN